MAPQLEDPMYLPQAFAEPRADVLAEFMRRHAFATLVTTGAGGLVASHVPLLYDADHGPHGRLLGHLARNNPQLADLAGGREAMAIFHGPHAYVSPTWYEAQPSVPTWNYAVVHAYGTAEAVTDPAAVTALLARLAATYEDGRDPAWRMDDQPERFIEGMKRGIGAFAIAVTRLEGKFKLNQNRSAADRRHVVAALAAGDAESAAVAALMRERGD
jgi:transcriptional regulator